MAGMVSATGRGTRADPGSGAAAIGPVGTGSTATAGTSVVTG